MKRILLNRYTTKPEGDIVTRSNIDGRIVVEIDENTSKNVSRDSEESSPRIHETKKISKQERVNRIIELKAKDKSRDEIKKTMYAEQYYFNNPNPASAFAGDWNSIV